MSDVCEVWKRCIVVEVYCIYRRIIDQEKSQGGIRSTVYMDTPDPKTGAQDRLLQASGALWRHCFRLSLSKSASMKGLKAR